MPEIITTPHALVQTNDGKRFYVNSGLVSVDNTETAVVDINNIGERDIKLSINPIIDFDSSGDNMTLRVKSNSVIIYQALYDFRDGYLTTPMQGGAIHFIIPSNTLLQITFVNSTDSSAHDCGVSCYGKFV